GGGGLGVRRGGMENLRLSAGDGKDTFAITSTAAGARTKVNGGGEEDFFVVGNPAATMDDIRGTLAIDGQAGLPATLFLYDAGATAHSYTFRPDSSVARSGGNFVSYA